MEDTSEDLSGIEVLIETVAAEMDAAAAARAAAKSDSEKERELETLARLRGQIVAEPAPAGTALPREAASELDKLADILDNAVNWRGRHLRTPDLKERIRAVAREVARLADPTAPGALGFSFRPKERALCAAASVAAATGDAEVAIRIMRAHGGYYEGSVLSAAVVFDELEAFKRLASEFPGALPNAAICDGPPGRAYAEAALAVFAARGTSPHELFYVAIEYGNAEVAECVAEWAAAAGTPVKATADRLEMAAMGGSLRAVKILAADAERFAALISEKGKKYLADAVSACRDSCSWEACESDHSYDIDHAAVAAFLVAAGVPESPGARALLAALAARRPLSGRFSRVLCRRAGAPRRRAGREGRTRARRGFAARGSHPAAGSSRRGGRGRRRGTRAGGGRARRGRRRRARARARRSRP